MEKSMVLVIHDARDLAPVVKKSLAVGDWRIVEASTRKPDLSANISGADCIVMALDSDDANGMSKLINRAKSIDDNVPVIIVGRSKSIDNVVAAMRKGAYDYLSYPLNAEKLRRSVVNAIHSYELTKRVFLLENQVGWRVVFDDIVGNAPNMQEIFGMISMVAKSNATVLVTGGSGTGKELVAHAIHRHSTRSQKSFIDINCGAIPRELLENELFGHEKGAYTGADKRYIGSCERADGGTLFLDEISEMDPLLQVKLLRFLQERSFTRVGGDDPIKVDVRIITATNRDIRAEVEAGKFREDLYYRLNVVPIHMPLLSERREDIPLLAKHFLDKYTTKNEKIFLDFSPQSIEALINYDWPGNVRELENVIERAVVLHNDTRVKLNHLPQHIAQARSMITNVQMTFNEPSMAPLDGGRIVPLDLVEKYAIEAALKRCMGNVGEAARKLRVGQATLYRKIKQYGLR